MDVRTSADRHSLKCRLRRHDPLRPDGSGIKEAAPVPSFFKLDLIRERPHASPDFKPPTPEHLKATRRILDGIFERERTDVA
jgi:hypothetical protein